MRDDDKELNERGVGSSVLISTMVKHIGVKIVGAAPMNLGDYNKFRGWDIPDDENPATEGYLVQYPGDGYISWCPKDKFEEANQVMTGLTFGYAIESAKKGCKIARKGWNGKGIFVELQTPDSLSKMSSPYLFIDTTGLQTDNDHAPKSRVPWLASQTDMLSDDWMIVG